MPSNQAFDANTFASAKAAAAVLQADSAGSVSAQQITNDVVSYYNTMSAVRGYAAFAIQVATDSGFNGAVANQNVIDGLAAGTNVQSTLSSLKLRLALSDWQTIESSVQEVNGQNTYFVPDIQDISNYHIATFQKLGLDPTTWSGLGFAAENQDYLGSINAYELQGVGAQNLPNSSNGQYFSNDNIVKSLINVTNAVGWTPVSSLYSPSSLGEAVTDIAETIALVASIATNAVIPSAYGANSGGYTVNLGQLPKQGAEGNATISSLSVATSSNGTSVIETDQNGNTTYLTQSSGSLPILNEYNASNSLIQSDKLVDGADSTISQYDPGDTQSWSKVANNYNQGHLKSSEISNRNGTTTINVMDSSGNIAQTNYYGTDGSDKVYQYDTGDMQNWSSLWMQYNSSGVKTEQFIDNRDGSFTDVFFDQSNGYTSRVDFYYGGSVVDRQYDTGNNQSWASLVNYYNTQSQQTEQDIYNNDGSQTLQFYDTSNGKVNQIQYWGTDGSSTVTNIDDRNVQTWSEVKSTLNQSNQKVEQDVFNRDGSVTQMYFNASNGKTSQVNYYYGNGIVSRQYDTVGQQSWSEIDTNYTGSTKNNEIVFNRDGSKTIMNFNNAGNETSLVYVGSDGSVSEWQYDVSNQQSWSQSETDFSSSGQIYQQVFKQRSGETDTYGQWSGGQPHSETIVAANGQRETISINSSPAVPSTPSSAAAPTAAASALPNAGISAAQPIYSAPSIFDVGDYSANNGGEYGTSWGEGPGTTGGGEVTPYQTALTFSVGYGDDGSFDPVVLNLHNTTVSTSSVQNSGVSFKAVASGLPTETGWITPGEGFLVDDPSGKSITSADQLIPSVDALKTLDTNHDGIINSADSAFSSLSVWEPSVFGNGGTLASMSALGIKDIRLDAIPVEKQDNGNLINSTFSFDYINGQVGSGADVSLETASGSTTQWANPGLIVQAISTFNPPGPPSTVTPLQPPTKPEAVIAATHS